MIHNPNLHFPVHNLRTNWTEILMGFALNSLCLKNWKFSFQFWPNNIRWLHHFLIKIFLFTFMGLLSFFCLYNYGCRFYCLISFELGCCIGDKNMNSALKLEWRTLHHLFFEELISVAFYLLNGYQIWRIWAAYRLKLVV